MIVSRYHDICCGHRVYGHPGACSRLHGHNYRIHFHCEGEITHTGMVIDFSIIKATLCNFLDLSWDHKMLIWEDDPMLEGLIELTAESVVAVTFNPTAENMAEYLIKSIGPMLLPAHIKLAKVIVEETRKCSAVAEL